jgi:hypothetical protein
VLWHTTVTTGTFVLLLVNAIRKILARMHESLQEALRVLRSCQERHQGKLLPRHQEKLNAAAHWIDYVCEALAEEPNHRAATGTRPVRAPRPILVEMRPPGA